MQVRNITLVAAVSLFSLLLSGGQAATLYVWQNSPSPNPPYSSWATAAHAIQTAVDAAVDADTVLVTNGTYTLVSRIGITKGVAVRSMNPYQAIIDGNDACRCVYLDHAQAEIAEFKIQHGRVSDNGGGVYIGVAGGTVSNCWLESNRALGMYSGGGVYCTATGLVTDCLIQNCSAEAGGGVYCFQGGRVENCLITLCAGDDVGGGVVLDGGGSVRNSVLASNSSAGGGVNAGGGVYANCGGLVEACTIRDNYAAMGGGGVFFKSSGVLRASSVCDNEAEKYGGGVYLEAGGTVAHCTIYRNQVTNGAPEGLGGGVYMTSVTNGIYIVGGSVEYCFISNNVAGDRGGGVSMTYGCALRNNLVINNYARYYGGGVHCANGGQVENCTIVTNFADRAGGIFMQGTGGGVVNSIVLGNACSPTWPAEANGLAEDQDLNSFIYSCTWPANPCRPNGDVITNNAHWVDAAAGDFRLRADSPCRDAGLNAVWMFSAKDLAGRPRVVGGRVDMGAYEYQVAGVPWQLLLLP